MSSAPRVALSLALLASPTSTTYPGPLTAVTRDDRDDSAAPRTIIVRRFGATTPSLRDAAEASGFGTFVGAAGDQGHIQTDATYNATLGEQYDLVTAENACKVAVRAEEGGGAQVAGRGEDGGQSARRRGEWDLWQVGQRGSEGKSGGTGAP